MSVTKRPDGKWRARYRGADGKERSKHFARKVDATRWLADQTAKVNRGEWLDPALSQVTIDDLAPTWLASKQGLKPTSRRSYDQLYRVHVKTRWGHYALSAVTYAEVVTWVGELSAQSLSPSRTRQALLVLKQILDLAVLDGRLGRNVAVNVKGPRARKGEQKFLTHSQLAALAEECGRRGPQYHALVLVLGYTGLRWGEARALRVRRVDLPRARLEITDNLPDGTPEAEVVAPKSHRRRTVPLPRLVAEELAALVADKQPGELVFTSATGRLLDNGNFRRDVLDDAVRSLGLGPFTPHHFRDTAASLAVSAGANVKAVQRMLGHASAAMTLDVYSGLFADDLDRVAEQLNEAALQARQELHRTTSE